MQECPDCGCTFKRQTSKETRKKISDAKKKSHAEGKLPDNLADYREKVKVALEAQEAAQTPSESDNE